VVERAVEQVRSDVLAVCEAALMHGRDAGL
jgi:hypothetical protein